MKIFTDKKVDQLFISILFMELLFYKFLKYCFGQNLELLILVLQSVAIFLKITKNYCSFTAPVFIDSSNIPHLFHSTRCLLLCQKFLLISINSHLSSRTFNNLVTKRASIHFFPPTIRVMVIDQSIRHPIN